MCVAGATIAQEVEFTADRPGASTGPGVVARKVVQLDLAANLDVRNPKQCWSFSCGVAWQINNPKR